MSKRNNSTYSRIRQSSRDTLTSRLVVYSTVHHKLHKKPLEEVTMSFAEVTRMLGDFNKAIDQDKLIADKHVTVPVTLGKQSGFISVSLG